MLTCIRIEFVRWFSFLPAPDALVHILVYSMWSLNRSPFHILPRVVKSIIIFTIGLLDKGKCLFQLTEWIVSKSYSLIPINISYECSCDVVLSGHVRSVALYRNYKDEWIWSMHTRTLHFFSPLMLAVRTHLAIQRILFNLIPHWHVQPTEFWSDVLNTYQFNCILTVKRPDMCSYNPI